MKTLLYESHKKLNAKFINFAGWKMPLYYQGIHQEVLAVRSHIGLFDVSHMGRISINGKDTLAFLEYLSANTVLDKAYGKAFYTVFCDQNGYAVDDLLIYLIDNQRAFIVVNACNREKDLAFLKAVSKNFDIDIQDHYNSDGILSLQGPKSALILQDLPKIEPFAFITLNDGLIVSRTGYTGEEGYEFYGTKKLIKELWDLLCVRGERFNLQPCGLAARDILRLEMGYALYGHELSESIYPLESVAKWVVKLKAHNFIGKKALELAVQNHLIRYPIALKSEEKIPARAGYDIYYQKNKIGEITSGGFSPTINHPVALGMIQESLSYGTQVDVLIRTTFHPFKIVKLPFIKRLK